MYDLQTVMTVMRHLQAVIRFVAALEAVEAVRPLVPLFPRDDDQGVGHVRGADPESVSVLRCG